MTRRTILLLLAGVAALLLASAPARAELCKNCQGKMYIMSVGTCEECGGGTSSGAHKLCKACSKKLSQCEHCRAALGDKDAKADDKPRNGSKDAQFVEAGQEIRGKVGDRDLMKLAPENGFLASQKQLDNLLDKWDADPKEWKVDFDKNIVLVGTAHGPNIVRVMARKKDGAVKVLAMASRMGGPGFGWAMKVYPRKGVKTVNGVELQPVDQQPLDGSKPLPLDLDDDGKATFGPWTFQWTYHHKASRSERIDGKLLYAGQPVPMPSEFGNKFVYRTPWGLMACNDPHRRFGWRGWHPVKTAPDANTLPHPVALAGGRKLDGGKELTAKHGKWKIDFTLEKEGTWSEKRIGTLTWNGEAIDARAGQWLTTPWGVMQFFDNQTAQGWLSADLLSSPLRLEIGKQILSPDARSRIKTLKAHPEFFELVICYAGPRRLDEKGPKIASLTTRPEDKKGYIVKIGEEEIASLLNRLAEDGALETLNDLTDKEWVQPTHPTMVIDIRGGMNRHEHLSGKLGWSYVTLHRMENLAEALGGDNKAGKLLLEVIDSLKEHRGEFPTGGDFSLTSPAFRDGQRIPKEFTGEGKDVSPPMAWTNVPEGTGSFALVCHDPDAPAKGGWTHWVIYNIPATHRRIARGVRKKLEPAHNMKPAQNVRIRHTGANVRQGMNSWKKPGYGGPMPPKGHGEHRYVFTLYALKEDLDLPEGLSEDQLGKKIKSHVLKKAELTGIYERK